MGWELFNSLQRRCATCQRGEPDSHPGLCTRLHLATTQRLLLVTIPRIGLVVNLPFSVCVMKIKTCPEYYSNLRFRFLPVPLFRCRLLSYFEL